MELVQVQDLALPCMAHFLGLFVVRVEAVTRRGQRALTSEARRQVARIMRLHLETHPRRAAPLFGITPQHMRDIWREHLQSEMAGGHEALQALKERLVQMTMPLHGSNAAVIVYGEDGADDGL